MRFADQFHDVFPKCFARTLAPGLMLLFCFVGPKGFSETKDELDRLVLENFELKQVSFEQALKKWRAAVEATGGKARSSFKVDRITGLSSTGAAQAKVSLDLTFRYVLAGECLRRIVQQANQRARKVIFEVQWYDDTGFNISANSSPRGLEKVRNVTLKKFKVKDTSLLNLIREWRAAVKLYGERGENEIYYQALEIKETFKVPLPIELNLDEVPALEALQAICDRGRATVKWDNFGRFSAEQWDFEIIPQVGIDTEDEWTNKEGKTIRALFLLLDDRTVRLKMSGGTGFDYPMESLSHESLVQALRHGRTTHFE